MNMKKFFLPVLVVATLVGCHRSDSIVDSEDISSGGKAYLSISVNSDIVSSTRSSGAANTQTLEVESKINTLTVLGFNNNNIVGIYNLGVAGGAVSGDAFEVDPDITEVFVVANATEALSSSFENANNVNDIILATRTFSVNDIANGAFLMTSGANDLTSISTILEDKSGLVPVVPYQYNSIANEADAKAKAEGSPIAVSIDRVVAKVVLAPWVADDSNAPDAKPGSVSITDWDLNITNKSSVLYSPYVEAQIGGSPLTILSGYRKDHNYEDLIGAAGSKTDISQFTYLGQHKESTVPSWIKSGEPKYCLENTMVSAAYQYAQTTKLLIKGTYVPNKDAEGGSAININDSYFSIYHLSGTKYYTASQLLNYYNNVASETQKIYMDAVIAKVFPGSTMVNIESLVFDESTPYAFATSVEALNGEAVLNFYHQSVCYYALNIQHYSHTAPDQDYYYGVVRNNSYAIAISNILKPGFSYIPNPIDDTIIDPANPDIEDPNDPIRGYLSVKIIVKDWTTWSQESDLD